MSDSVTLHKTGYIHCIDEVIVCMLSSSAVDRGFEFRSGQIKDYKISMCCFSAKHTDVSNKNMPFWLGIRIMRPSEATCLPIDHCSNELAI